LAEKKKFSKEEVSVKMSYVKWKGEVSPSIQGDIREGENDCSEESRKTAKKKLEKGAGLCGARREKKIIEELMSRGHQEGHDRGG